MRFNTAISAMMELTNAATRWPACPRAVLEPFAQLLGAFFLLFFRTLRSMPSLTILLSPSAPFAPHLAEEAWSLLGHEASLANAPWPAFDERLLVDATVTIAVQVGGKLRATITVPRDATEEDICAAAAANPAVAKYITGKELVKTIFVPAKLVNYVVR